MKNNAGFRNQSGKELSKLFTIRSKVLVVFFMFMVATQATAQTYTILHTFGTNLGGLHPHGAFVQGPDGTLYGSTGDGGLNATNGGQIFKMNPDGTRYTVLKDLGGQDGAGPEAALLLVGTTLYGTTAYGGISNNGTVFKLNTDGSGFQVLKRFAGNDGSRSRAALVLSGTTLYGTTSAGGSSKLGTIFKIDTDGSGFMVVRNFTGSDGSGPAAGLCLDAAGVLYGTTASGGGNGNVFSVNSDGSNFRVLKSLGSDVRTPTGGLVISGSTLYGTTLFGTNGGQFLGATVFKINTDGSGFVVLKDFTASEGVWPSADLLISGDTLYGLTYEGGAFGYGAVFALNSDGGDFTLIKSFTLAEGPSGHAWEVEWRSGLFLSGTSLYGTLPYSGRGGFGALFQLNVDGSGFAMIKQFAGGDGQQPHSGVAQAPDGVLYGTTELGGRAGCGTVFKLNCDGSGYAILKEFTGPDGSDPEAGLAIGGTTLYGTTSYGGLSNSGTIFAINTDGSGFNLLRSCGAWSEGVYPATVPVLSGTTLYGSIDYGKVFRINTDGSGYSSFAINGGDGVYTYQASLLLDGSTLYGTDWYNFLYRINTDWSGFAVIKAATAGWNGPLVLSGNTLFGTSQDGGTFHYGFIFKVNTDGTGYSVLKNFTGGSDGRSPSAGGLILRGDTLFGIASGGGGFGCGTVFKINTNGTGFAVLKSFSGADGRSPYGNILLLSGTNLYGTTLAGGALDQGVAYRLSVPAVLPVIVSSPDSQTAEMGSTVVFKVTAGGVPPLIYQWFLNDSNLVQVSTNHFLTLPNIQPSQAGTYTVAVTNAFSSATSAPAVLSVIAPVERRPVPVITVGGRPGDVISLDYCDSMNPGEEWETMATMTMSTPSQFYFDASTPLPPQRFYRARPISAPGMPLVLGSPFMVPAITVPGIVGDSVRLDAINQIGPTDAWFTLDTVTLSNATQLYFDVSAPGQPQRLYRLVPLP